MSSLRKQNHTKAGLTSAAAVRYEQCSPVFTDKSGSVSSRTGKEAVLPEAAFKNCSQVVLLMKRVTLCPGAVLDDRGLQLDSLLVISLTLSINSACNGPLASKDFGLLTLSGGVILGVFPPFSGGAFLSSTLEVAGGSQHKEQSVFCSRCRVCSAESDPVVSVPSLVFALSFPHA